jgi:hypothetical protein
LREILHTSWSKVSNQAILFLAQEGGIELTCHELERLSLAISVRHVCDIVSQVLREWGVVDVFVSVD